MTDGPWTFDEARSASDGAEREQRRVESEVHGAYKNYAHKERTYRVALARRILELRQQGMAITACEVVAKGDQRIAELREERDIAEGLKETAKHAAWRANADRRDTSDLIRWSARRDLAEYSGPAEREPAGMTTYGARRAA
jgi:hypothetical protein